MNNRTEERCWYEPATSKRRERSETVLGEERVGEPGYFQLGRPARSELNDIRQRQATDSSWGGLDGVAAEIVLEPYVPDGTPPPVEDHKDITMTARSLVCVFCMPP